VNIYAFGAVATLALLLWCFIRGQVEPVPRYWPVIPAVLVLGFNPFWVPFMRGYIGICVVAINIFVLWLYFRRPIQEQKIRDLLFIAVLLACSVILRRWNAYWIVAFFIIAFLDAARAFLSTRVFTLESAIRSFRVVFVVGLGAFATLSVLAWPLVITMVTTDYSDIYSAYADQSGSVTGQVGHFVRTFGLGLILFTVVAAVYLLLVPRTRWLALLLSVHTAVIVLHFSSTQQMGPRHMYVLMPAVFALLGLAVLRGLSDAHFRTRVVAQALLAIFILSGLASNYAVFGVNGDPVRQAMVPWVPDNRRPPLVRNDIEEFDRLVSYLDSLMDPLPPNAGLYALSSSTVFSSAQLKMLEVSTGIPFRSRDQVLRTAAVDKRDGFPRGLLKADIVIVGVPIQYNVPPEDQRVIGIPAELMLSQIGIGSAFRKLAQEFTLDEGVSLFVYERTRENRADEVEDLSRRLREVYPDRPGIYRP
jgi:hypothetical protein